MGNDKGKHIASPTPQTTYLEVERSRKAIIINNFIGGISWGLGATIGVSLILTLVGFVLSKIHVIPIIGEWATEINRYVSQHE